MTWSSNYNTGGANLFDAKRKIAALKFWRVGFFYPFLLYFFWKFVRMSAIFLHYAYESLIINNTRMHKIHTLGSFFISIYQIIILIFDQVLKYFFTILNFTHKKTKTDLKRVILFTYSIMHF